MGTTTAPDPPAATPADPPFELLGRNLYVQSLARTQPIRPKLLGDLARIGERLYCRWPLGNGAFGYAEVTGKPLFHRPSERDPTDYDITTGGVIVDPAGHVEGTIALHGAERWGVVDLAAPADADLKRFHADYPAVAEMLKVPASRRPTGIFSPGVIRALMPRPGKPCIEWYSYCVRHIQGDFGAIGKVDPSAPAPTLAERFTAGLQPPLMQNRIAMAAGHGFIRSKYPVPDEMQAAFAGPGAPGPVSIDVTTVLVHGHAQTLCQMGFITPE